MPRFLSNLRSLSISTSTSPLRSSLPRSRAAYSISKPLLASDAPPPSSNPPVEDATNPELPIEGNEYEVAEIVDETVPEYKWPDRMPQQGSRIRRPTVIPGKPTRKEWDREVPAPGRFTRDNAYLSTLPHKVRERLARALDRLKPGEELPVLGPHDLRRWWKERMEGKLPENPSTPEGVRKSQEDWKTRNMQKRQLMRGVKDQMNEETGYLETVVKGIRVYFPNLIFSMIPNFTAPIKDNTPISKVGNRHIKRTKDPNVRRPTKKGGPGKIIGYEPYNPFIATFKVSKQLNKHDIKSYLKAVYNLDTTFVRTIVYNAPKRRLTRDKGSTFEWGVGDSKRSFKKAVVGLAEPFYYPFDRQNMNDIDLARFENDLHAKFNVPRGGNVKQEKIRKEENDALHPRTNRYNRLPNIKRKIRSLGTKPEVSQEMDSLDLDKTVESNQARLPSLD